MLVVWYYCTFQTHYITFIIFLSEYCGSGLRILNDWCDWAIFQIQKRWTMNAGSQCIRDGVWRFNDLLRILQRCAFVTRIKWYRFPMTYIILTYDFCINILYEFLKFYIFTKDWKIGDCVFKQLKWMVGIIVHGIMYVSIARKGSESKCVRWVFMLWIHFLDY